MKKDLLNEFQIEELEQRFEMSWISKAEVSVTTSVGTIKVQQSFEQAPPPPVINIPK